MLKNLKIRLFILCLFCVFAIIKNNVSKEIKQIFTTKIFLLFIAKSCYNNKILMCTYMYKKYKILSRKVLSY